MEPVALHLASVEQIVQELGNRCAGRGDQAMVIGVSRVCEDAEGGYETMFDLRGNPHMTFGLAHDLKEICDSSRPVYGAHGGEDED